MSREWPVVGRRIVGQMERMLVGTGILGRTLAAVRTVDGGSPARVSVDGIDSVVFASNDYLALRWHPKVLEGAERAVRRYGSGAGGSRLMAGSISLHHQLEEQLADFVGREAVVLFPTGYQANVGVLSALLGRHDLVACDTGVHASLIDGCRLAEATIRRFDRRDLGTLDHLLGRMSSREHDGTAIVADAVYSMAGDTLPLGPIIDRVGDSADPLILLDEAHSVGVIGDDGRGLAASTARGDRVDLITGTLSKALASSGGFVAGPAPLVGSLYLSRSMLFSTASNPAALGAALTALQILKEEPERRTRARTLADRLRQGLQALGIDTGTSNTMIVPAIVGDEVRAMSIAHELGARGLCVGCAVAPAVAPGHALVRLSVTAAHAESDIDRLLDELGGLVDPGGEPIDARTRVAS